MLELNHYVFKLLFESALLLQIGTFLVLPLFLQTIQQGFVLLGLTAVDNYFLLSCPLQDQPFTLLLDLLLLNRATMYQFSLF